MRVECSSINNKYNEGLTLKKHYFVLAIEVYDKENSNFAQTIGDQIIYRIENDNGNVVPYPSTFFRIVSGKLSGEWVAVQEHGCLKMLPKSWAVEGFWEDYYNDDDRALVLYEIEKQNILIEELTNSEIINTIEKGESHTRETILRALSKRRDDQFISVVIRYIKNVLNGSGSYLPSSSSSDSLVLSFEYLSNFESTEVEGFFVEYLLECGQIAKLTTIVNNYFSSKS